MQMEYSLSGLFAIVDHQPEGISITFLFGYLTGNQYQVPQQVPVVNRGPGDHGYGMLRDHEDMYRCLWIDIPERQAPVIFINDICRYFPGNYLAEYCIGHNLFSVMNASSNRTRGRL